MGVYSEHGGLDQVDLSWGHDEYLYQVVRDHLPQEALYMIRYHSFYSAHREGEYEYLMDDGDKQMFRWVREFNPSDLSSNARQRPTVGCRRPHYQYLLGHYF